MSYVILVRNPGTGKVFPIWDGDTDRICKQWLTKEEAENDTKRITVCQAWPYSVVEAP